MDDAGTWHLYTYCANDPINYVDPSGHMKIRVNGNGKGKATSIIHLKKEDLKKGLEYLNQ